ncbi:phosphoenolpyruvate carboxylase [Tanacetum coccineum]
MTDSKSVLLALGLLSTLFKPIENLGITSVSGYDFTLETRWLSRRKEVFQLVDAYKAFHYVFNAYPTQPVRRSLLQKHGRFKLLSALMRLGGTPPTPQDEMRAGMSYFHETIWKGVPKFLRRVDTAVKNIGLNVRVPYNAPLIQFSSWMCDDRDDNPRVTPKVTRDVYLLSRMMAADMYFSQI